MSADPADDTNALLFQIMRGANGTITSPADLPSASFSPPTGALPINILFSMSLTLALLASFLAVLGQQWLVYYRKRSGGGAEYQRWEQLRRYLGAKRWRLELVLDDVLPSVLQIALVIFCVAFILYLGTLSRSLCYAIAAPLCIVGLLILAMAIFAAWDRWCPFKSPLSHVIQPILRSSITILGRLLALPASFMIMTFRWLVHIYQSGPSPFTVTVQEDFQTRILSFSEGARDKARVIQEWFRRKCERSAEAINQLELVALKRVLRTSEDPNALVYAAINGQAISDKQLLRQILDDIECKTRVYTLSQPFPLFVSSEKWQRLQAKAMASFFIHLVFCSGSVEDFISPDYIARIEDEGTYASLEQALLTSEIDQLLQDLMSLSLALSENPADDSAECPYHVMSQNCMEILTLAFSPGPPQLQQAFKLASPGLTDPLPVSDLANLFAFRPVERTWFVALAITQAKTLDGIDQNEANNNPQRERSEQLERFRGLLLAYQKHLEA